jgi:hypothetical protein
MCTTGVAYQLTSKHNNECIVEEKVHVPWNNYYALSNACDLLSCLIVKLADRLK